eukprot:12207457-Alexandrium_andersonii.AAC.1
MLRQGGQTCRDGPVFPFMFRVGVPMRLGLARAPVNMLSGGESQVRPQSWTTPLWSCKQSPSQNPAWPPPDR